MRGIDPDRFATFSPEMRAQFMEDWRMLGQVCEHGTARVWCSTCIERARIARRAARARRILKSYTARR